MSNITFSLDDDEQRKLDEWLPTVKKLVCEKQIAEYERLSKEITDGREEYFAYKAETIKAKYNQGIYQPYEGAIGGGLVFMFAPNSIGTTVIVKYFEHEIDLTDYDLW